MHMKKSTLRLTAFLITATPLCLPAATVYWDSNDTAPGAGDPPNGTWGIDPFWSPDPLGAMTTVGWAAGDLAVFAAGSDAVNPYFVNVSGGQTVGGIVIEEGVLALSGSAVALGANTIQIKNGARLSIPNIANITATAGANLNLDGGTMASTVNGAGSSFMAASIAINVGALGGTVETANTGTNSTIYGGTIKGPGNVLTKTGSGEFRYQGAGLPNTTFAKLIVNQGLFRLGTTTVSGGMLKIADSSGLGFGGFQSTAAGDTIVSAGATVDLNGAGPVNEPIVLNGSGIGANGALINSAGTTATIGSGSAGGRVPAVTGTGSGYSAAPTVTISGAGAGATATATLGVTAASFTLEPGNRVYTVAPTVTISGGSGFGATAVAVLTANTVTGITVTNAGLGYTTAPTIAFSGGTSTGTITPTGIGNDTEFTVSGIAMTAAGSGYTGTPTYTFGSGNATPGTLTLSSVALASDSSLGGTGNIAVNAAVAESGGARALTKVGTGTLQLNGVQTYSTLNTQGGRTDLNNTLGTGTSILNANAQTNITVSVTLGALNIGAGAVVTLGNPPPPAPALAGDALADGFSEVGDALAGAPVQGVPEPGSAALLLAGALGLLSRRRPRII